MGKTTINYLTISQLYRGVHSALTTPLPSPFSRNLHPSKRTSKPHHRATNMFIHAVIYQFGQLALISAIWHREPSPSTPSGPDSRHTATDITGLYVRWRCFREGGTTTGLVALSCRGFCLSATRAHVSWIASFFAQLAGQRFADYSPSSPSNRFAQAMEIHGAVNVPLFAQGCPLFSRGIRPVVGEISRGEILRRF